MARIRTVSALAIVLIIGWVVASPGGGRLAAQLKPVQTITPLKTPAPPAPIITAWGPKEKVPTGDIIWVQGSNLQRDLLVLTLGDRAILPHLYFEMLPASSSTSTRIEFRTTSAMKTGVQTSSPLKVLHRGAAPVVLDADYHVVDRRARFSGISKYHGGETSSYPIFTEGTVQIDLDNLDFANEGPGIYREQVRLIRLARETSEPCPAPNLLGRRKIIKYYDWTPVSTQRSITWKRDPAIATRIVIYSVGLEQNVNATADLVTDSALQCGFIGYYGSANKPYKTESGCNEPLPLDILPSVDGGRGPSAQLVPVQQPPPLTPARPTYVVYSLRRAI